MSAILQFTPRRPEGSTCPACEGHGHITAFVHGVNTVQTFPCTKCDGTGWFTSLAHAEGEVRYWRSRWESVQQRPRARKERQTAAENLEFWTNKAAMYAAMQKAR